MTTLPKLDLEKLSLEKQYEDSNPAVGLTGINDLKIKQLKVDLLTSSESVKGLLLRMDQCITSIEGCLHGESRFVLLNKVKEAKNQLSNFNKNISYYNNALGKVLKAFQDTDVELGVAIKNDTAIIAKEMEEK